MAAEANGARRRKSLRISEHLDEQRRRNKLGILYIFCSLIFHSWQGWKIIMGLTRSDGPLDESIDEKRHIMTHDRLDLLLGPGGSSLITQWFAGRSNDFLG